MSTVSPKRPRAGHKDLVESHLPLVHSLARRYAGSGEPLDDLVQAGAVGLVKAGNRFDESRGVAFATFAAPVIEGEIRRHLRDRSTAMRIPRRLQRTSGALRHQRDQLAASSGHSPSTRELAAALSLDEDSVQGALLAELARTVLPLSGDEDKRLEQPDDSPSCEDRVSLARCVQALGERDRKLIFLRFHADMTERQIARELKISQAQVSRALHAALERLRKELTAWDGAASAADSATTLAISPAGRSDRARTHARKSTLSASNAPSGALNIGAVPASQASHTVAEYLQLPYSVAIRAEREGDEPRWIATAEELPGCAAQGRTPDEAVELLRGAMASWLEAALAQRRDIPVPGRSAKQTTSATHSGRFLVRMPALLHTQLAQRAEREHLSLNRFITDVLAASVSPGAAVSERPRAHGKASASARVTRGQSPAAPSRALRIALVTNIAVIVLAAAAAIVLLALALHTGV